MLPTTPDRGRRPTVPLGLIGMIGLVAAIESAVGRHEARLAETPIHLSWRDGGRSARTDALGAEVLCFGDSLVKLGVLPRVLEDRLGRPAYNLALPGARAPASYFQLRNALAAGARPRAVVVDFHSATLTASVRPNRGVWPELLGPGELIDLGWHSRDGDFLASSAAALLWPSVRRRAGLRREILAGLRGDAPGRDAALEAYLRNGRVNRGAIVAGAALGPPDTAPVDFGQWGLLPVWRPHPTNVGYVRRFLDLAASRRLPVFWLIPPVSPPWQAECERLGHDARYSAFVRAMQDRYPNLVVVDGRHAGYELPAFADLTHLNARGASALTEALADLLRDRLGVPGPHPRRVALPPYRDRPGTSPLIEDLAQSQLALELATGANRR